MCLCTLPITAFSIYRPPKLVRLKNKLILQVSRRYAELSAAFISVNESCPTNVDGLTDVLRGLQQEIENFVVRMSNIFPQRREQIIFVINNYDVILSVMGVRITDIKLIDR